MKTPIYMDYHATTPVDPRVLEAMLPYFTEKFGNAASKSHQFGWQAEDAVDVARGRVAAAIGAEPREIVFTSGATESNNLAIKGVAEACASRGDHIVTCATEHKAVLDSAKSLERRGVRLTVLEAGSDGSLDLNMLADAIGDRTVLVTLMAANNEIGTIHPVGDIGRICRERGVVFHTDATQAIGRLPFDVGAMNVDLASMSAHKMYGPKGCGALYVRRRDPRVLLTAQTEGGGHERGMRSGTLNVPGIVGLGRAAELAVAELPSEDPRLRRMRDRLLTELRAAAPEMVVNGPDPVRCPDRRLSANLNVSFPGFEGSILMLEMKDVAVSASSACSSGSGEISHVLRAIGASEEEGRSALRFGLGRFTTDEEIDVAVSRLAGALTRLRGRVGAVAVG
jgi:cysteine desulfurase